MVTTAKDWKKKQGAELPLPSGNVALVRPVGMETFLRHGMIPNSLRRIAVEAAQGQSPKPFKIDDFDESQIEDMMTLFDSVCVFCVLEPKVTPIPVWTAKDVEAGLCDDDDLDKPVPPDTRESERWRDLHQIQGERLYVDEVDLNDKMFVFQFAVGGTKDAEKFREEQASALGAVSGRPTVDGPALATGGGG